MRWGQSDLPLSLPKQTNDIIGLWLMALDAGNNGEDWAGLVIHRGILVVVAIALAVDSDGRTGGDGAAALDRAC